MEEGATIGTTQTGVPGAEVSVRLDAVVAAVVVLFSIVPVYLAQRLTSGADGRSGAGEPATLAAVAGSQSL